MNAHGIAHGRILSFEHLWLTFELDMTPVLIVPGIGNSGPTHWQTLWEQRHPAVTRVMQRDWDRPDCDTWADELDAAIQATAPRILVAHSLGCLVVAHRAARRRQSVRGVLMVAVPDPARPSFPIAARGFHEMPLDWHAGPLKVVSSSSDPYSSPSFTERIVANWGAEHVALGAMGHINAASGLGDWPDGWALIEHWRQS